MLLEKPWVSLKYDFFRSETVFVNNSKFSYKFDRTRLGF